MSTSDSSELREAIQTLGLQLSAEMGALKAAQKTAADEIQRLNIMCTKAIEGSHDAKRRVDALAHEAQITYQAMMTQSHTVTERLTRQDAELDKQTASLARQDKILEEQTKSLGALLKAEEKRQIESEAAKKLDERRWKWVARLVPLVMLAGTILTWALTHVAVK